MALPIPSLYALLLLIASFVVAVSLSRARARRSLPYPPGPPGEFLIDHLRVIPFEDAQSAYLKRGKEYSE
jgi:hypothetical protein